MNLKFGLLLLLITFKQVDAQNNQSSILNQKISIEAQDETIRNLLKRIETQIHLSFSYDSKIIDSKKKRTVSFEDKTLSEVISFLFDNKVKCKVKGNNIVLYKSSAPPPHYDSTKPAPVDNYNLNYSIKGKPSKIKNNDTLIRYFIDVIVPNSLGKDSIVRTYSIDLPPSHFVKIDNDTTILLLKKDSLQKPK